MAVDLFDLVEPVKAAVNVPGGNLFPNASEDTWVQVLANAFWTARLAGLFTDYRETEGSIVPITGTTDLGREHQQLIVLYSAYNTVRARLLALPSGKRLKAGPVESETQFSAAVLQALLKDIRSELDQAVSVLAANDATTVQVFDLIFQRDQALLHGDGYWVM